MENPSHRRQAGYSKETRDLSSDAPYAGHCHAGARDDEGRPADLAACQHQDHSRDLHAGNSGERALGHQLSDAGDFQPAYERTESTEEPSFSPEEAQFSQTSEHNGSKRFQVRWWGICKWLKRMAPQVGLEPTTLRLTAGCSAIELLRSGSTRARVLNCQQNHIRGCR